MRPPNVLTAGGSVGADQVLELLSRLVGRSLVIADTQGVETRFRLLETIRQYAQEHLDEGGDGDRLHAEHASYYALFGDLAIRNLDGTEGIDSELRLERELDNIGAALRWSIETDDAETAVRLFAMWHAAPRLITDVAFAATLRWAANTVVAMPKASGHPQYPATLAVAGAIAVNQGDPELAARRCDEAVAAEQRLGTETTVMLWLIRSNADLGLGHPHEAVEHAHQAVALSRARGEPAWLAQSLSMSALAQALQGDAASARSRCRRGRLAGTSPCQPAPSRERPCLCRLRPGRLRSRTLRSRSPAKQWDSSGPATAASRGGWLAMSRPAEAIQTRRCATWREPLRTPTGWGTDSPSAT